MPRDGALVFQGFAFADPGRRILRVEGQRVVVSFHRLGDAAQFAVDEAEAQPHALVIRLDARGLLHHGQRIGGAISLDQHIRQTAPHAHDIGAQARSLHIRRCR